MLIKLSGNIFINPNKITSIRKRVGMQEIPTRWVVYFDAENSERLNQQQFNDLMQTLQAENMLKGNETWTTGDDT